MDKKTVKQRILALLLDAYWDSVTHNLGCVFINGQRIFHKNGWVAQSVLANPTITGSTEGKRRFRELRADISLQRDYLFETKCEHRRWFYRILPRKSPELKPLPNRAKSIRLQFSEV